MSNHEKCSGCWNEVIEWPLVFLVELFECRNSKLFSGVLLSSESYLILKEKFWEIVILCVECDNTRKSMMLPTDLFLYMRHGHSVGEEAEVTQRTHVGDFCILGCQCNHNSDKWLKFLLYLHPERHLQSNVITSGHLSTVCYFL